MRQPDDNTVNLVIALPAEAKPLIDELDLQRDQGHMRMPVYVGRGIRLVITGPGIKASAQGVHYLRTIQASGNSRWINLGICGHGTLEVGAPLMIDRIIDMRSAEEWSLPRSRFAGYRSGPLTCVTRVQSDYLPDMAYDMESSGFIQAVADVADVTCARVFKIVSDNPHSDSRRISGKFVRTLFRQQLGSIRSLLDQT
jgi:hypothetical protein